METEWAVSPGTEEAQEIAETIQRNAEATKIDGEAAGSITITEGEACDAVAQAHQALMHVAATFGGDHWKCDQEEYGVVRDDVAPEVVDEIPDRILYEIKRGSALGTYAQIILLKSMKEIRE
jgi:frataxin-like iron-binding protein CyaY